MIRKVLVIPTGTQVKVQSFDKEWDAWINVKPGSALQDSTRLKCVTIVSVMPSASVENRPENTTSPQDLVLTSLCIRKLVRKRHRQNCCRKPRGGWAQHFRGLWQQDWSWTGSRGRSWYRKPRGGWAQLFRGLWQQDWSWTGSRGRSWYRKPRGGWAQLFRGLWQQDWSWTGSRGTSWYSYSQTSYTAEITTNQLPSKVVWRGLDHGRNASSSRTLLGVHTDSLTSKRVKVTP